jgi:hypothetical protein
MSIQSDQQSLHFTQDEIQLLLEAFNICPVEGKNSILIQSLIDALLECCTLEQEKLLNLLNQPQQPQQQQLSFIPSMPPQPSSDLSMLPIFQQLLSILQCKYPLFSDKQKEITFNELVLIFNSYLDLNCTIFSINDVINIFNLLSCNTQSITIDTLKNNPILLNSIHFSTQQQLQSTSLPEPHYLIKLLHDLQQFFLSMQQQDNAILHETNPQFTHNIQQTKPKEINFDEFVTILKSSLPSLP